VYGSVEFNLRSVLSLLQIVHIRFIRRHFFLKTSAYILQTEYRLLCVATVLGSCQSSPGGTRPSPNLCLSESLERTPNSKVRCPVTRG
jgi:hypothetical protein